MNRLPFWFKQNIPGENTFKLMHLFSEFDIHTVCQEAKCPNIAHCFDNRKATFLILGDTCTRNCRFCAVKKTTRGSNLSANSEEPARIAEAIKKIGINYAVITSVTRDDLADGGARIFAQTIIAIKSIDKNIKVEALIPDFGGSVASLSNILEANPDVVAHNIETVSRLYPCLRPLADYKLSLLLIRKIKELKQEVITKSSLMLGFGEAQGEVIKTLQDLRDNDCDILTLGQYLAPSSKHYPVKEFVSPEQFMQYKEIGEKMGFKAVLSGPLVRSSSAAEEVFEYV